MTRPRTSDDAGIDLIAAGLTDTLDGVFAALEDLRTAVETALAAPNPRTADLAAIDAPSIAAVEGGDALVVGAGYAAAPGILADSTYWLQWWSDYDRPATRTARRLHVELDPAGELFRDYTELGWFSVSARSGSRHIAGPYVDYMCTDQYTLTFSVPVRRAGRFAGIIGADVYADDVERLAMARMTRHPGPCALVNGSGRVVAAVHTDLAPGQRMRMPFRGDATVPTAGDLVRQIADLPLYVVTGPPVTAAEFRRTA